MCLIASKHPAAFARLYPMNLLTWPTAQAAGLGLETDMSPKQTGSVDNDADPNTDLTVGYVAEIGVKQVVRAHGGKAGVTTRPTTETVPVT